MTMRKIVCTSLVGLALTLGGCDKGEPKTDGKKTADAKGKTDAATKDGGKTTPAGEKTADGGDAPEVEAAEDAPLDERVVKAASLAAKIEVDPAKADEVLAAEGMTREAFDELIYQVSQPGLAEQYRLARARGEG